MTDQAVAAVAGLSASSRLRLPRAGSSRRRNPLGSPFSHVTAPVCRCGKAVDGSKRLPLPSRRLTGWLPGRRETKRVTLAASETATTLAEARRRLTGLSGRIRAQADG